MDDKLNEKYTQAIWELTDALQEENQMESALANCLGIMTDVLDCEGGFVWLLDNDSDSVVIITCTTGMDMTGLSIPKNQGIIGRVISTAESIVMNGKIPADSPLSGTVETLGLAFNSQMVTPLNTPGEQPFGCIQMFNKKNGKKFGKEDRRLAGNMSALVALDIDDKGFKFPLQKKRDPIISLRGITKEFLSGENILRVLKGIDLDIYQGEFLVILGESGCGKSTLMNIIGGMDPMTDGTITLDGKDFSKPTQKELTEFRRDYIGFIFQSYNLMPNLSALENLKFIAEISNDPVSPEKALEQVGLSEYADHFTSQMSGGQQQRVSIARAITKNPKLILADEPTAALDYDTSIEVLDIVEEIVRNQNKTVIMITHNPEIAKMADRVVKLRGGLISSIRINMNPLHARELTW